MTRSLTPPTIRRPFANYSHGVLIAPGARVMLTSGQLGVGPDDAIPAGVEAQAVLCFENIGAILAAGGMGFGDVIKLVAYVTERSAFPVYGAVRDRYVPGGEFASTLVIVSGFTRPEFLIEIEATAAREP